MTGTISATGCNGIPPELLAFASTVGSAASTTPPVGTITHQFIPSSTGLNGTYCLGLNVTTTSIASVPDGTKAMLKNCSTSDITSRNVTQQWTPSPKPPSRGLTGFEPGSRNMLIYREDSGVNCIKIAGASGPATLTGCSFHDGIIGVGEQNFTFVAGSSFVGKGAPGPITWHSGTACFDIYTQTTNGTSVDYLGTNPCNGSLSQQLQVNNDSTISISNMNKCVGQLAGILGVNSKLQIVDCVPGNANQAWIISRIASQNVF
ncbi:hypothetical protein C8J57DRAFT_1509182 [Mycena rebaudengoi]|nr:hypothetical protein C8J57DRAFT_1509182 [Mycena rebaudengoi]